tara:strand:+ start:1367 stop:1996 length:630 start_codon:yes stop_codon:yes gene_type:complete
MIIIMIKKYPEESYVEEDLHELYGHRLGDISLFLPILRSFSMRAQYKEEYNIVELGVRGGCSTLAFLSGLHEAANKRKTVHVQPIEKYKLYSCDIEDCSHIRKSYPKMREYFDTYWEFYLCDSIELANIILDVVPDIVFIDTNHEYKNTLNELELWVPRVNSGGFIILHDTCSTQGVPLAIDTFLKKYDGIVDHYNIECYTGLGVMKKL